MALTRKRNYLWGILFLFGLLTLAYSVIVPFGEPSDEPAHLAYIWYLLNYRRLPVQSHDPALNLVPEGHHPPGYYVVVALLTGWAPYEPYRPDTNPYLPVGYDDPHIVQQFLHPVSERFPWEDPLLAAHVARLVSIGMGMIGVGVTYQVGKQIAPRNPQVALLAAGTHAFVPQFVYMSGAINNDNAATLIGSLVTLQMLRLLPGPTADHEGAGNASFLTLGVLMGLGVLSKVSLLAMLPAVGWTVWCAVQRRPARSAGVSPIREMGLKIGLVLGPMLLVSGWWMWRSLRLYGDPLGYKIWMITYADFARRLPLTWDYALHLWWQQFRSFWGLFGWSRVFLPTWLYLVLLALTLLGVGGVVRHLSRNRRGPPLAQMILLILVFAGFVLSTWRLALSLDLVAAQGRFFFPALSAIAALLATGWLAWWRPARQGPEPDFGELSRAVERQGRIAYLLVGGLCALSVAVLLFRLRPVYSHPLLAALPPQAQPVEGDFGPGLWELVGWEAPQPVVGQTWPVTLYWRARRELSAEERRLAPFLFVHLVDGNGEALARWDGVPTQGRFPPPAWSPDTIVADTIRLPIRTGIQAGLAHLWIGFYFKEEGQLRRVAVHSPDHLTMPGTLVLGPVMLRPPQPPRFEPQQELEAGFGPLRLLGFDLDTSSQDGVQNDGQGGGEALRLVLYWQAEQDIPVDYTVFVHLIGAEGLAVQGDAPPCGGECPTSLWRAGDVWRDEHLIPAASLPAVGAPYTLSVGWYESSTGERLPASSVEGGRWQEDRVSLCTFVTWPDGECTP